MKILICGDRNYSNRDIIREYLSKFQKRGYSTLIVGGAKGADTIAEEEGRKLGFNVIVYKADWKKYGRAAGPVRNAEMLKEKPDTILAFHDNIANSKGTKNLILQALKLRKKEPLFYRIFLISKSEEYPIRHQLYKYEKGEVVVIKFPIGDFFAVVIDQTLLRSKIVVKTKRNGKFCVYYFDSSIIRKINEEEKLKFSLKVLNDEDWEVKND